MASKTVIKFVLGNAKLGKGKYKIVGFGIPADYNFNDGKRNRNTCAGAKDCRDVCYAKQGMYLFSNVKAARNKALEQTLDSGFVTLAIADLTKLAKNGYNVVRVHDSGDFYSQEYLNKWYSIAKALPNLVFYAYTKALNLDLWKDKPSNFRLIQSLGGRWDSKIDLSKPHSRIFTDHNVRIANGYVDGNVSDEPAFEGEVKIGLVYHGNRNMNNEQKQKFSLPVV